MTYSTGRKIPANLVTIDADRAFEVMALNKQGVKPDDLSPGSKEEERPAEYVDLVEQESLTFRQNPKEKEKRKNSSRSISRREETAATPQG